VHRLELLAALTIWTSIVPDGDTRELLRWDAPPSCPSSARLEAAIAGSHARPGSRVLISAATCA
jgi:hypothetical protein